jgi:uncharacterized protein (UPF0332 family)
VTTEILDKAQTALASAKLLLSAGDSDGATSRAYYAMFDAAKAALAWAGGSNDQPQHKTHSGLIAGSDCTWSRRGSSRPNSGDHSTACRNFD